MDASVLPPWARLPLVGTCNRCGLCCSIEHNGQRLICEHLDAQLDGKRVKPLGTAEASSCRVYAQRVDGMTVRMLNGRGEAILQGPCGKDSPQEDHMIAQTGLGKGCSLTLAVTQGQFVGGA